MKQLTVLSGKGGTGKTTIVASFAVLAKNVVIADCDVDAPDLHLLLDPKLIKAQEFRGSKLATVDEVKCIKCGLCRDRCRFNAITEELKVDPFACEGCGVCTIVCPTEAMRLEERISGHLYISRTVYGPMAHALLSPGEANSGKLVALVRYNARLLAEEEHVNLILIDGAPGIGCPVIASVTGTDVGMIVTEPTISGIHDLKRVLRLLTHFNVLPLVCVNMYDINSDNTKQIWDFCEKMNVRVVGEIPFDRAVTEAMVNGKPVVEYSPRSNVSQEIGKIWDRVYSILSREG
ncbi:MAG: P-loop NTPase [Nitrososphaeria archaeon]